MRRFASLALFAGIVMGQWVGSSAQAPIKYEPTLESLHRHPLPEWYAKAKFGIFVCWGPYSVPGWAPLSHRDHDFDSTEFIRNNPYAEWYYNVMRIDGSPTQAYHRAHYGAGYDYYKNFIPAFDQATQKWKPDEWAQIFHRSGARYMVLTSKFHDGYSLWPTAVTNPKLSAANLHPARDIVGELNEALKEQGIRMGIYYSGGFDWTFLPGPVQKNEDYEAIKPQSEAYGNYVIAQMHELVSRYHPALLWNDIDWPKSGKPMQVEADYYNAVPDGVVDDRMGIEHADFVTKEYRKMDVISAKKWEENRGLGRSFGYNRAEGDAETIPSAELVALLVDVVSKNGNLLLDVGPEADGTIPAIQMDRLMALGAWLQQNGEAIYDTTPWTQAAAKSAEGDQLRFTRKDSDLFVTVLGNPKARTVTVPGLAAAHVKAELLGEAKPLVAKSNGADLRIELPAQLPGKYAYVIKLTGFIH
jgi:alpha-L-fucosidase